MFENLFVKFDTYSVKTDAVIDDIHKHQDTLEKEMILVNQEMDNLITDMQAKLTVSDGKRIWRHFQRFAEYNDLKLLYNKFIPELAKVEYKIYDFTLEMDQAKLIIRRFDETMAHKAEKVSIDQLYLFCS